MRRLFWKHVVKQHSSGLGDGISTLDRPLGLRERRYIEAGRTELSVVAAAQWKEISQRSTWCSTTSQRILGISGCCHAVCGTCSSFTTVFMEWDSNADLAANTHLCDIWQVGVDSLQTFLWVGCCCCVCARARKHFHNVRINMTFQWRKWLTADTIQTTMKYKCQKSK